MADFSFLFKFNKISWDKAKFKLKLILLKHPFVDAYIFNLKYTNKSVSELVNYYYYYYTY